MGQNAVNGTSLSPYSPVIIAHPAFHILSNSKYIEAWGFAGSQDHLQLEKAGLASRTVKI